MHTCEHECVHFVHILTLHIDVHAHTLLFAGVSHTNCIHVCKAKCRCECMSGHLHSDFSEWVCIHMCSYFVSVDTCLYI